MHYLYIIYSEKIDKHYIGETPDVENRLIQHNTHYFKTNFSKSANDWKLLLKYPCENRKESLFLRSEEHTSELQSRPHLVCRLLLEKKKKKNKINKQII